MTGFMRRYISIIDAINHRIGRIAVYSIFVMMGILLWSSVSKTFFTPSLWTLEMAQFAMVAYYILGGPYSMQAYRNEHGGLEDSHVRMDLFYGSWSPRTKAMVDVVTILCLLFFLGVLVHGALASLAYALGYFGLKPYEFFANLIGSFLTGGPEGAGDLMGTFERSNTAWRPFMWPIKLLMALGFVLMLFQAFSELFKDILRIRGETI